MKPQIDFSIYLVTNREVPRKMGRNFYAAVEEALKAGVTLVQLREKNVSTAERIEEAKKIKALCDQYQVPLLIDDDVVCAKAVRAAGVHLGQSDEALKNARKELGSDAIIGISAHNLKEAMEAERGGADYLGVGALYHTVTKKDASDLDMAVFKEIIQQVSIPVVGIGGIGLKEYGEVMACGADGCAMISSILGADSIMGTVAEMKRMYKEVIHKRNES
jgi:thiamine-phosphate pyrophosphorylase